MGLLVLRISWPQVVPGRLRLDKRKHFFSRRAVLQWHSCPGRWGGSLSLVVFKERGDVALRDVGTMG